MHAVNEFCLFDFLLENKKMVKHEREFYKSGFYVSHASYFVRNQSLTGAKYAFFPLFYVRITLFSLFPLKKIYNKQQVYVAYLKGNNNEKK